MYKYPDIATHWTAGTPDEYNTTAMTNAGDVSTRWEDNLNLKRNPDRLDYIPDVIVYTQDATIVPGSFLYLGSTATASPKGLVGAYIVRYVSRVKNITGSKTIIRVALSNQ